MEKCHGFNYHEVCGISNTHDKFEEAQYFLFMMVKTYHNPDVFRFNMNAFIQALRNVTFALQSEKGNIPDFDNWYSAKQEWMKQSELLRNFIEGRNIVVKRGNLEIKSEAAVGLFRYYKHKLGMMIKANPFRSSEELLQIAKSHYVGFLIDEEHSAIGEQCGIERKWVVEQLGGNEVVELCIEAWKMIGEVVKDAHLQIGLDFEIESIATSDFGRFRLLLESDLDPELPRKWGWV